MSLENLNAAFKCHHAGRLQEAKELYLKVLGCQPDNFDALHMIGVIEYQCENYESSINYIKGAISLNPKSAEIYTSLGNSVKELGDVDEAIKHYRHAIELNPDFALAHFNLANSLSVINQKDGAIRSYETAIQIFPEYAEAYFHAGCLYGEKGRDTDAIQYYKKAIEIKPEFTLARRAAARYFRNVGDIHGAIEQYEKVINVGPNDLDALSSLSDLYEQDNNLIAARKCANLALGIDADNYIANLSIAKLDKRAGRLKQSMIRLKKIMQLDIGDGEKIRASNLLAHVLDGLSDYDDAFKMFEYSQHMVSASRVDSYTCEYYNERIGKNKNVTSKCNVSDWNNSTIRENLRPPVFMVGFPRSGTTLTEQILSSHSHIVVSDEKNILYRLIEAAKKLDGLTGSYPDLLLKMTSDHIAILRNMYWVIADELIELDRQSELLIDKLPLNIIEMGFINRIFPDAKVILNLRDPRDVCLSCYFQIFRLNHAMVHFLDIHNTALFYSKTMDLWLHYDDVLSIDVLESKYEDLVSDMKGKSLQLLNHIGMDWEDDLLSFYENDRYISTPSYRDTKTPIYKRSLDRWKNYREHIGPVIKILQPYIDRFGYS